MKVLTKGLTRLLRKGEVPNSLQLKAGTRVERI